MRTKTVITCNECGAVHAKWSGQCSTCGAWNTIVEESAGTPRPDGARELPQLAPLARLDDVSAADGSVMPTGIGELERVLGGGITPGSVTLLGGEPGIGKSTLVLQLASLWPDAVLYVSAEESQQQVKTRAARLGGE